MNSPINKTAKIGQILAIDKIPKPSVAETALPKPRPIAKTKGTVTGPVVTPALSQATFTNSSVEKCVRTTASIYRGIKTVAKSKLKTIFPTPRAIPKATPPATLYISMDFLKAPLVNSWTVNPNAFKAGSARVAPKPKSHAKAITMVKPSISL